MQRATRHRERQSPPRVVIEGVKPEIDAGRFAVKRTVGEALEVRADIFTEGHDALAADLLWRREGVPDSTSRAWNSVPMRALVNDRWSASFTPTDIGRHVYSITAWIDRFETWRRDTGKKHAAGVDVSVESLAGVELVKRAGKSANGIDAAILDAAATELETGAIDAVLDNDPLRDAMRRWGERTGSVTYERELGLDVDRERARFSSWYEFFPRSCADEPGRHGTFADRHRRLCEPSRPERARSVARDIVTKAGISDTSTPPRDRASAPVEEQLQVARQHLVGFDVERNPNDDGRIAARSSARGA